MIGERQISKIAKNVIILNFTEYSKHLTVLLNKTYPTDIKTIVNLQKKPTKPNLTQPYIVF